MRKNVFFVTVNLKPRRIALARFAIGLRLDCHETKCHSDRNDTKTKAVIAANPFQPVPRFNPPKPPKMNEAIEAEITISPRGISLANNQIGTPTRKSGNTDMTTIMAKSSFLREFMITLLSFHMVLFF